MVAASFPAPVVPARPASAAADDAALLAAMQHGHVEPFGEIYRRYRSAAFATAYRILGDPAAAEDAVHDAFLSVWRGIDSFQPSRGSLRPWLLTIVRNTAIDRYRGRRTLPLDEARLDDAPAAASGFDEEVVAAVAGAGAGERIRRALDALPPEQRLAIELAFFEGLTHPQIAARTGLPLGTVKGRLRLGLRKLRQSLGDLAPEPATA